MTSTEWIHVRGAKANNLRNIDIDIPRNRLSVITGPSGGGKSSLALGVLLAESKRRMGEAEMRPLQAYLPSTADSITGLTPALAIEPSKRTHQPKSQLLDLCGCATPLRLLLASHGKVFCPHCQAESHALNLSGMVDKVLALPDNSKIEILAPLAQASNQTMGDLCAIHLAMGFLRARADGIEVQLDAPSKPKLVPTHFEIVVDRIKLRAGIRNRVAEALEHALRISKGIVRIDGDHELFLAHDHRCREHGPLLPSLDPSLFSLWSRNSLCPCRMADSPSDQECPQCHGIGFNAQLLAVQCAGHSVREWLASPCSMLPSWLPDLKSGSATLNECLADLQRRLECVLDLGLGHLPLGLGADHLSSGEFRKAKISALCGGDLVGLTCIVDEPAAGMQANDTQQVCNALHKLKERGNTVVVVEHNPILVSQADYIIEIGPAAGDAGGQVLRQGWQEEILAQPQSLAHSPALPDIEKHKKTLYNESLIINVLNTNISIAPGQFWIFHGPCGAGKTRLLKAVESFATANPQPFQKIETVDSFQAGRSQNSIVATASGIMDALRDLWAKTPEAKARGYSASKFSLATKGGRCEHCQGSGVWEIIPGSDQETACPYCQGKKYRDEILEVRFKTMNMADALDLRIRQAKEIFQDLPYCAQPLNDLSTTGLDYLKLGQPTNSLSGGEMQRLKLSKGLRVANKTKVLYLLDEPSRGLHFEDCLSLAKVFQSLVQSGHSVVLADNHPAFLHFASHSLALQK